MKKFNELSAEDQKLVKDTVIDLNTKTASFGLLGFKVTKLSPTKKNQERFQEEFMGHSLCGCVGCMELAKIFIDNKAPDIQEEIRTVTMNEIDKYIA